MKHKVKITETYVYEIEIEGENEKDAIEKAKNYYNNANDGYTGVASALTKDKVKFKIIHDNI